MVRCRSDFQNWGTISKIEGPCCERQHCLCSLKARSLNFENGPSILEKGWDPQFAKPIWGGENLFWSMKKSSCQEMGVPCPFCKKKWKQSVKFGLCSCSNILLPHIGGSHPVPSLSVLSTERRGTIPHISHHRHHRRWCTFFQAVYLFSTENAIKTAFSKVY